MFKFAQPYAFFLLIPVAALCWYVYRRRVRRALLFAPVARIPAGGGTWRVAASYVFPALFLAGMVLGVLALARPQKVFSVSTHNADVIAIEMVVDTSGSMEALDLTKGRITPSNYQTRLDVVKETFAEFVNRRPGDLIGLVTFGGYASTRCPLTADREAILHVLSGVEIPKPVQGAGGQLFDQMELATAIGDGLATAAARLEHAEVKSKILVLLSDGESNAGVVEPDEAMEVARKMGIKVYTIGVGTPNASPLMATKDMLGRTQIVRARGRMGLDEAFLKRLASTTGGHYFGVRDADGLERALAEIDKLEKTEVQQEVYNQYEELFLSLLLPAIGCIVLGTTLNMLTAKRII